MDCLTIQTPAAGAAHRWHLVLHRLLLLAQVLTTVENDNGRDVPYDTDMRLSWRKSVPGTVHSYADAAGP